MANVKISALTAAATPLAGTEVLPIVQSGVTVNVAVSNLTAGRSVSSTAIAITGSTSGTATIVTPAVAGTPTLTLPTSTDTLVGKATTDTLTNKTLTAPVIATIVNTGTLTLPTATDTLVGRDTTDTLTNKTLTLSGLLTQAAGADIASAATIDLSTVTGNGPRITGTTAISAVTMTTGQQALVVADGALPLTYNATTNKLNSAAANVTLAAGDMVLYSKDLSGIVHGNIIKADGTAVVAAASSSVGTVPRVLSNIGLAVTLAANAVTIALKGSDGNNPSASNPVGISYRNATLTNGTANLRTVTAALSTVISSGSTGGTVSAQASRIWIAAIDNAGTVELAWYQSVSGTTIAPFDEGGVITTTAEGGAGAADSAQTWYSTTARTAVPFTILGCFDSTQTTAGTWAQAITALVINPWFRPGQLMQLQRNQTGAVATGTTTVPEDDTIPQITEGDQYMTQAITPKAAANLLRITTLASLTSTGAAGVRMISCLFQDATANALAVIATFSGGSGVCNSASLNHAMIANTVSATTLRYRAGTHSATTVTFNGSAGARLWGGVLASQMNIEEIAA